MDFDYDGPADHYDDFAPEHDGLVLIADCIRCGGIASGHPDTMPVVWVNTETRCPVRPDGTQINPGERGTKKEPVCKPCENIIRAAIGHQVPVRALFPLARLDLITPPHHAA